MIFCEIFASQTKRRRSFMCKNYEKLCEYNFYIVFYNFDTWRIFYVDLFGMHKKKKKKRKEKTRKITKTMKTNFCSKLCSMQHWLRVLYKTDLFGQSRRMFRTSFLITGNHIVTETNSLVASNCLKNSFTLFYYKSMNVNYLKC